MTRDEGDSVWSTVSQGPEDMGEVGHPPTTESQIGSVSILKVNVKSRCVGRSRKHRRGAAKPDKAGPQDPWIGHQAKETGREACSCIKEVNSSP